MEEEEAKRDRISEMPEEIKEQIVSSLCMKDAICTSSLSSVWRYSWVSLPFLDFGFDVFRKFTSYFKTLPTSHPKKRQLYSIFHKAEEEENDSKSTVDNTDLYAWQITEVGYLQMIDEFLQIYIKKNPSLRVLKKISLFVPMLYDSNKMRDYGALVVSRCLSLAKHNVTELDYRFNNFGWPFALEKCFPILESKTLTKLEVCGCYLAMKKKVDLPIDLPNLKRLRLTKFHVSENMLETLFTKCPALEKLEFSWLCGGFNVLRVPRLSKLKKLKVKYISNLDLIEINSMSLQCLSLLNLSTNCKIKMDSNSCNNLVNLFVDYCGITDDFFNNVAEFPKLKTISLIDCSELKHIKITSNSLTRFEVKDCPNLSRTELETPKLLFIGNSSSRKSHDIDWLIAKQGIPHPSFQ
ncbi:F-box/LRR-repeat protein At2g42720-like [Silene latifolia]|uniref:F-box/LRR-repeat protein At2g42720-like n=1 Tax=Silene latifolia TaxID=37657 RepID=UPI003D78463A